VRVGVDMLHLGRNLGNLMRAAMENRDGAARANRLPEMARSDRRRPRLTPSS
jgi:hypothetical protein